MGRISRKYKAEVKSRGTFEDPKTVEGEIQVSDNVPAHLADSYARDGVRAREGRGNKIVTKVEIDGKDVPWHS